MMSITDFMVNLGEMLQSHDITETSSSSYIQRLYTLNGKRPFNNLSFLRKKEDILNRLKPYADATYRNMLTAIVSVLKLYQDKPTYKTLFTYYSTLLNDKANEAREYEQKYANHKTAKQEKNWITWEEVMTHKNELKDEVASFCDKKTITKSQKDILLQFLILSLYTDIPPRRNQDYQLIQVVQKYNDDFPTDNNYLSVDDKAFYFNKYKTAKKYGKAVISIEDNDDLRYALRCYMKHHPYNKGRKGVRSMFPLLVSPEGSPLTSVNAITRILNKIFKKKVGSSMLRHIYLTNKYGDEMNEMKEDADMMGHSVSQQREYVKDKPAVEGSGRKDPDMEALLENIREYA